MIVSGGEATSGRCGLDGVSFSELQKKFGRIGEANLCTTHFINWMGGRACNVLRHWGRNLTNESVH